MRRIFVGKYVVNYENCRLYATDRTDGSHVHIVPSDRGPMEMEIGCGKEVSWDTVVGAMLHELLELCLHRNRHAYYNTLNRSNSASVYLFVLSHDQMDTIACNIAQFVHTALPELKKAYTQLQRKKAVRRAKT